MPTGRNPLDGPNAEARFDVVEALDGIAGQAGLTLTELALAWVDAHPAITSTIIGPKTPEQLDQALAAADLTLTADVLDAVDKVVRPGTDVPGTSHFVPNPALGAAQRRRA
jgi:aryl-alcohol dehydrogenase (NADP+)